MNEQNVGPESAAVDGQTDLDDVEGHGLKEVAAGLSAAAVITGGVAAMQGSDTSSAAARPSISTETSVSPGAFRLAESGLGGDTAVEGVRLSAASVDAASLGTGGATEAIDASRVARTGTPGAAVSADESGSAGNRQSLARNVVNYADAVVDSTIEQARETRDETLDSANARTSAGATRRAVEQTRASTARTVGQAVSEQPEVQVPNAAEQVDADTSVSGDVSGPAGTGASAVTTS